MALIDNPGKSDYVDRVSSNVRFDPKVKKVLDKFLEDNRLTLAGYVNDLVADDLKRRGLFKE